jgi:hypothetical protein
VEDWDGLATGEIDYPRLVPKFPPGCLSVFELRPRIPTEQIVAAAERWRKLFEK